MSQWSVFGVDITPKFTDDIKNVLKVTSKKEIFFDVYECTYNGKNIIVEKVGTSDGVPVVSFEAVKNNKKYKCEALLVESEESELFLNENHLQFLKSIQKTPIKTIIEEKVEKVIPTNTVYEDKVRDVSEKIIKESQEKAQKLYDNKLKEYKNHKKLIAKQAEEYLNEKSESIRQELYEQYIDFLSGNDKKVNNLIKSNIDGITLSIDENNKEILSKVDKLSNLNKEELTKILSENIVSINNSLDNKIKDLNDQLDIILHDSNTKIGKLQEKTNNLIQSKTKSIEEKINSRVKKINEKVEDYKVDTLTAVVEKISENKSDIETYLKGTISEINEQVDIKNTDVRKILADELSNINEKLNIFSEEEDKKYKQLLENLNNLNKGEVKEILSEKINDKQLNSLKLDISKQFQNEMMSIKRLIEMSSGGGSVAKQFANGGTMDGSLNVTQNILSGGTNLLDIFNTDTSIDLQDVTDNGNTTTNSISSSGTIFGDIGQFTTLNALTANFTQTIVSTTSALSVVNDGTGPALYVQQSGDEPVATFVDKEGGTVIIDDGGNVGIGTDTPTGKLHIVGSAQSSYIEPRVENTATPGAAGFAFINSNQEWKMGVNTFDTFRIRDHDASTNPFVIEAGGAPNDSFHMDSNGNVGIGTDAPSAKLDVDGNIKIAQSNGIVTPNTIGSLSKIIATNSSDDILFGDASTRTDNIIFYTSNDERLRITAGGDIRIPNDNAELIFGTGLDSRIYYDGANMVFDSQLVGTGDFVFNNGNVGIGTDNPNEALTVSGNISASGSITSNGITSNGDLDMNGNSIVNVASGSITFEDGASIGSSGTGNLSLSGNVGIGTDSPASKLQIVGGDLDVGQTGENVDRKITIHSQNAANKRAEIGYSGGTFGIRPQVGNQTFVFGSGSINNMLFAADAGTGVLRFNTANSEAMRIDSDGNVGIGTDAPSAKLHIYDDTDSSIAIGRVDAPSQLFSIDYNNGWATFGTEGSDDLRLKVANTPAIQIEGDVNENQFNVDVTLGNLSVSTDNKYLKLGGSEDAGITYDGTNMVFDSQLVGAGDFIFNNGNVGIGVNPSYRLDINDSSATALNVESNSYTTAKFKRTGVGGGVISFLNATDDEWSFGTLVGGEFAFHDRNNNLQPVKFEAGAPADSIYLDSTGNVGIGTADPQKELHVVRGEGPLPGLGSQIGLFQNNDNVSDNAIFGVIAGTEGIAGIQLGDTDGVNKGNIYYDNSDDSLAFQTNGANERMRIDSLGNVGIGTDSPTELLTVKTTAADEGFIITNSSDDTLISFKSAPGAPNRGEFVIDTSTDSAHRITAKAATDSYINAHPDAGNFGIGTTSPSAKLDVSGNVNIDGILALADQTLTGLKTITADNNNLTFASVHGIFGYSIGLRGNRGSTLGMESEGSILDISAPSDITLTPGGVTDIQSNLTVSGNVGIGTDTPSAKLEVVGHFTATTKSFLVDKPNGGKLQYGVTESNEHSVFVRGKTDQETINLPEEWKWLVDEDSVTVTVTPVSKFQPLYVISQSNNEVKVGGVEGEYNYIIYGTRKDVAPLEVNV